MNNLRKDTVSVHYHVTDLNVQGPFISHRKARFLFFLCLLTIILGHGHIMQIFNQSLETVSQWQLETAFFICSWHCYNSSQVRHRGPLIL